MLTELYGPGTHVSCCCCGRRIFPRGSVELEIREATRWVKLTCASPSCPVYRKPTWYSEEALEIYGTAITA